MTIENPCEFIKKIRENPLAQVTDVSFKDLRMLQDHLTTCENCAKLVEEMWDQYKDLPDDPNKNDGRWN
jgi:hypothetical protein